MPPDCGGPKTSLPTPRSTSPAVRHDRATAAVRRFLAPYTGTRGETDLGLAVEEAEGILAGAALQCAYRATLRSSATVTTLL